MYVILQDILKFRFLHKQDWNQIQVSQKFIFKA